jgi:hypothetical protein
LFVSFISFSQEAVIASEEALLKSVAAGSISMILPEGVSADDVQLYSKYYTSNFETEFDSGSSKVTFNMVQNDAKSRMVIMRFLGANKIANVKVGTKTLSVLDFYNNYLK